MPHNWNWLSFIIGIAASFFISFGAIVGWWFLIILRRKRMLQESGGWQEIVRRDFEQMRRAVHEQN